MEAVRKFLARKNIVFSAKRYFIDAMGAMAQGLFCTLLVGTILNTLGQQLHIGFLTDVIVTLGKGEGAVTYTIGGLCSAMVGPGMAVAIGRALESLRAAREAMLQGVTPDAVLTEAEEAMSAIGELTGAAFVLYHTVRVTASVCGCLLFGKTLDGIKRALHGKHRG